MPCKAHNDVGVTTSIKILTIGSTIIEHPPNGQKRWRVTSKKLNSLTKGSRNSKVPKSHRVIECFQNSLQIAAAGQQYQGKKLPSKRPRNKPGMPKDFIFVDLSPVKNAEDSSDEGDKSSLVSPAITPDTTALDNQELITVSPVITPDATVDNQELNTVSPSITPDTTVMDHQESNTMSPTTTPDTTALDNQKLNAASYFELSASNDSFQSLQSDEESIFSSLEDSSILSKSPTFETESYIQECNQINSQSSANNDAMLGLGILNMDMTSNAGHWMAEGGDMYFQEGFNYEPVAYNSNINPFPDIEQSKIEPQFEGLKRSNTVSELPTQAQQPRSHKRAKSTCEPLKKRSSSTLQFRVYKAPSSKGKKNLTPEFNHRRTISEPSLAIPRKSNAFDFVDFDNQMFVGLNGDDSTPNTDYSETEDYTSDLLKSSNLDSSNLDTFLLGGCGSNEFLGNNQFDFDFNSYVSY